MSASFPAWALDPARSLEERYGIELLVEGVLPKLHEDPNASWRENYEATLLRRKARLLNPAYQPEFTGAQVEQIADSLPATRKLDFHHFDDRPLRDLAFLQFVPELEELSLGSNEIADLTWLRFVPCLRQLYAAATDAKDFRPIGQLGRLESLHIWPKCPWPDLRGWERLTSLRVFHFGGNKLALRVVPSLPQLRTAEIKHNFQFQLPIRDLHDLPEMPELRVLHLDNTWRLDGIERSPKLINLEIYGYFDDLTPLGSLSQLTHLTISGGEYETLAPLAALPELRWLKVRRQEPQDYPSLVEAPKLHEIIVEICTVTALEVATLNAALSPWSEEFGAHPPRPLRPVRLLVRKEEDTHSGLLPGVEERRFEEDIRMAKSEARWFAGEVRQRLAALLGPDWGRERDVSEYSGGCHVTLSRLEDIERVPQVIEALRQIIAACRYKWSFLLMVDSMARYEEEDWGDEGEGDDEFDAERERENWEDARRRQREQHEFQERLYRYQLKREEGAEIRPEEFAPTLEPSEEEHGWTETASSYDTGARLSLHASLFEDALVVHEDEISLAEYLTGLKADLSEPPPEQ